MLENVTVDYTNPGAILESEKKPKRGRKEDSRKHFLEAAFLEFCDKGFDGARIETIAERAGYNKALIYRYFHGKKGLFEAVLHENLRRRIEATSKQPSELGDVLVYWFRHALGNRDGIRLLIREAIYYDQDAPIDAEARSAFYSEHRRNVEQLQDDGKLHEDIDPNCLILAFTALASFPMIMPQMVQLVTGSSVQSSEFQERWSQFLRIITREIQLDE
jgi:AcrR family transcriptional regulator